MRAILRNELRALVPIWILGAFMISGDILFRPLYQRLDQLSWLDVAAVEAGGSGVVPLIFAIFALAAGYSAFPREHDEGTIQHLFALPISRAQLFMGKVCAGLLVCWSIPGLALVTDWLLQSQNAQSFESEQWTASVAGSELALRGVFASTVYAYGVLASYLRRFGFVLLGVGLLFAAELREADPGLAFLSPAHLLEYQYFGERMLLPLDEVGFHLASSALCLSLAGWLWMARSEGVSAWFQTASERAGPRWALRAAASGGVVVCIALLWIWATQSADSRSGEASVRSARVEAPAEHALFSYPRNLQERARPLVEAADGHWAYLMDLLGAEHYDGLLVDLGEASRDHDGVAAWSVAKVALDQITDLRAPFVLVHELAHIAQHRVSERRLPQQNSSTNFFSEGMAHWVAYDRVPNEDERRVGRLVAAWLHDRHSIPFDVLADRDRLLELTHPSAEYLLGELWTEALVQTCGREALRGTLEAFARPNRPDLSGSALWQDHLQSISCELESVSQRQSELIAELRREAASLEDALPRISGGLTGLDEAGHVRIEAKLDRPPQDYMSFLVTVRANASTPDNEYRNFPAYPDEDDPQLLRFDLRGYRGSRDTFQFAFGVQLHSDVYPLYESWRNARAPKS